MRAGALIGHDPIGILLPACGSLLLQLAAVWSTVRAPLWWAVGAWVTWWLVSIPLRRWSLLAASRDLDPVRHVRGSTGAFYGLHLLTGPLVTAAFAAGVLLALGPAMALAALGFVVPGLLVVTMGSLLGVAATAVLRGWFGTAPAEVLFNGRSAISALRTSTERHAREIGSSVVLVLTGDVAVVIGALACGAGALPGVPFSDLAMLDRWASATPPVPGGPSS